MRHPLAYKQRGAAALFAAIGLLGMLTAAAFAIDLAQMYVAKRDLQNMANLAALDVARAAGGCLAPGFDPDRQAVADRTARATLNRLGGQVGWLENSSVQLGTTWINADATRSFQPNNVPGESFAFRVDLQRPMPTLVIPLLSADGMLKARAASSMAPTASFTVSSFVASVDPTEASILNGLLGDALGAPLALSVVSYQGLIGSSIPLLDVADEFAGQTVGDLLTQQVQLPGLLRAIADALFAAGDDVAGSAVAAIEAVAPNQSVDLLSAVTGGNIDSPQDVVSSLGGVSVNALDLVQGLAYQLGEPVLQLTPDINISGLASVSGVLELGSAPNAGAGPALQDELSRYLTTAATAQGKVELNVGIALPLLGDLVNLDLTVDVAETEAELTGIDCAGRGEPNHKVHIRAKPSIARISVNNDESNPLLNLPVPDIPVIGDLIGVLVGDLVKVCWVGEVNLDNVNGSDTDDDGYVRLDFTGPFDPDNPIPKPIGSSLGGSVGSALEDFLNGSDGPYLCGNLELLNKVLDALTDNLDLVVDQLVPVLNILDASLLDPLLKMLGISVGGAHVSVLDVDMPPPVLIQAN